MRIFHELVVDEFLEVPSYWISKTHWQAVMGNIDLFRFIVVADCVSGVSPTLWLAVADSPNLDHFLIPPTAKVLVNQSLVVGQTNTFTASLSESDGLPLSYGAPLVYTMGGTSPKAHVRVWVTGRGNA